MDCATAASGAESYAVQLFTSPVARRYGMTEKVLLKDVLFNSKKVEQLADELWAAYPKFNRAEFVNTTTSAFPDLELKARIGWIAECLKMSLPRDYLKALKVILRALPAPNDPELTDGDYGDFIYAPYAEFVARYGCTKQYLATSLHALYEITQRFSVEFAIRVFLIAFPSETMKALREWVTDPNYHVRRLCSEGTRPSLPWAQNIGMDVTVPLCLLDTLFGDPTRYVTRSVANHINDISKLDANLAMDTLGRWTSTGKQTSQEMDFIIRHALRTLVKKGNPRALKLLGFQPNARIQVNHVSVPSQVAMDIPFEISCTVKTERQTTVMIDYIVYFQDARGTCTNQKVCKLTTTVLDAGITVIRKNHVLRSRMTTRTLYRGLHYIEIQINGKRFGKVPFDLV